MIVDHKIVAYALADVIATPSSGLLLFSKFVQQHMGVRRQHDRRAPQGHPGHPAERRRPRHERVHAERLRHEHPHER